MQTQRTSLIFVMASFLCLAVSLSKGEQTTKTQFVSNSSSISENRITSEASPIAGRTTLIRKLKKRLKTEKQEHKPPTSRQVINLDSLLSGFTFNQSSFLDTGDKPSPLETTTISSRSS